MLNMMKKIKKNKIIITIALSGLLLFIALFILDRYQKEEYTMVPFQIENGWGYEIYYNDQLFIRQEFIPAIPGKQRFIDKASAQKVGHKVAEKLNNHQHPAISISELKAMDIKLNDK